MLADEMLAGVYVHHAGDVYQLLGAGKESNPPKDDRIDTVYYRRVLDARWFHAPIAKFFGLTDEGLPRFRRIDIRSDKLMLGATTLDRCDDGVRKLLIALAFPNRETGDVIMAAAAKIGPDPLIQSEVIQTNLGFYVVARTTPLIQLG